MDSLFIFMQMMLINIVLSGDNAVLIAMASKHLPEQHRKLAVWWGALGAVAMRIVLTIVAVFLLHIPYLQGIGSILLFYIAIKLLLGDGDDVKKVDRSVTLIQAISTIIIADLIMSLDNVLAIAAITRGHIGLLIIGIGMSLPLIIWGSHLIVRLLNKYPQVILLGGIILAYAAGEMFVAEPVVRQWLADAHRSYEWVIPLTFTAMIAIIGVIHYMKSENNSPDL